MSQMEIDVPSTPSLRSVVRKRARSPASPSPLDRPSKRASGSAGRTRSPLNFQQRKAPYTDANNLSSPLPQCRASDDWVAKTSGLKLDSPLVGLGQVSLPESEWKSDDAVNDTHEVMMIDIRNLTTVSKAWPYPSQENNRPPPFDASDITQAPFLSPLSLAVQPEASVSATTQRSDIHIHIQPATPSNRDRAHSAIIQSTPISMSDINTGVWFSPTTQAKKPRVTMGPRPDCEKCKTGVKGHWMHVD